MGAGEIGLTRRPSVAAEANPDGAMAVLVVDDHPLWRQTLRTVLEHGLEGGVVEEAGSEEGAVTAAASHHPDVVVMDLDLSAGGSGVEATRRILAADHGARVLVLSSFEDPEQVAAAVQAGARGYLLKTARSGEIIAAVRHVAAGGLVFPPELADTVLGALRSAPASPTRAPVEVVVLAASVIDREGVARILTETGMSVGARCAAIEDLPPADTAAPRVIVAVDPPAAWREALLELVLPAGTALLLVADRTHPALAELVGRRAGVGQVSRTRLAGPADLASAIRRVAAGEIVVDAGAAAGLLGGPAGDPVRSLTDRELAVLRWMAAGYSNTAIGEHLHLSPKTVESHIGAILAKLGVDATPDGHRRVQAVLAYQRSPLAAEGAP